MPYLAIVSSGRARNVPRMEALCAPAVPTWYVRDEEEAGAYRYVGATRVVVGGGLVESRNRALDDAGERPCAQLSDDLTRLRWASRAASSSANESSDLTVVAALDRLVDALDSTGAYLAGVAPTPNLYFYRRPVTTSGFVVGDFILVRDTHLRFDPVLRLKEDYDYTLQHLEAYGVVARVDAVLASFAHRTNRGGAVDYRTAELEQEAIAYLKGKWPGALRDNGRRENEVVLRWPPKAT